VPTAAIIGTGLIGNDVGLALWTSGWFVTGWDPDRCPWSGRSGTWPTSVGAFRRTGREHAGPRAASAALSCGAPPGFSVETALPTATWRGWRKSWSASEPSQALDGRRARCRGCCHQSPGSATCLGPRTDCGRDPCVGSGCRELSGHDGWHSASPLGGRNSWSSIRVRCDACSRRKVVSWSFSPLLAVEIPITEPADSHSVGVRQRRTLWQLRRMVPRCQLPLSCRRPRFRGWSNHLDTSRRGQSFGAGKCPGCCRWSTESTNCRL